MRMTFNAIWFVLSALSESSFKTLELVYCSLTVIASALLLYLKKYISIPKVRAYNSV